jgi:hypothetical protein
VTTLRGSTSEFPLESVIGLLAGTSKTGELQVRSDDQVGALGFANGRLVAAVMDNEVGDNALGEIFSIHDADFEFTPWQNAPDANLEAADLVAMLKRAADARDRLTAIREQIPDDRTRFRLSERAADQGAVTFTPERWRALLAVNGERDVLGIADHLRLGRMDTLTLLSGLVREGVIETIAPPPAPRAREPERAPARPEPAAEPEPEPYRAPEPPPAAEAEPAVAEPSTPPHAWTPPSVDLDAEMAERFGAIGSAEPTSSAEPEPAPQREPARDERLSSLTGVFTPGSASGPTPPAEESAPPAHDPWASPRPSAASPQAAPAQPESWSAAPPASRETPTNAWAPGTPEPARTEPPAEARFAAPPRPDLMARVEPAAAPAEEKKKGGLFGMFRREEPTPIASAPSATAAATAPRTRASALASFSNALLAEFTGGAYGKGKIETRMGSLLMRVDEQADPIDRPLPIVDDLIDATALERENVPEEQVVPYLATLVRQIYEDAERAFGKDKARKGYKAAQQQVFRSEAPQVLQAPDVANKLPRV